jgi:flagellar capping protein FliD
MLGSKRLKKAIKESPTAVRNALVSRLRIEVSDLSKGGISAAVKFPSHSITGWEKDKSAFVF